MSLSSPTTPDELPELMLAKEVAEYLRIPLPTVYHLVNKGVLPGVQIGGRWRIKRSLIDRDVLKKEPVRCLAVSLRFHDGLMETLVGKSLSSTASPESFKVTNENPDVVITDQPLSTLKLDGNFSGRVITVIGDTDSPLVQENMGKPHTSTFIMGRHIGDNIASMSDLMGLSA